MIYFFYYPLPTMQILKVKSMDKVLISKDTVKKLFLYFLDLWEKFLGQNKRLVDFQKCWRNEQNVVEAKKMSSKKMYKKTLKSF